MRKIIFLLLLLFFSRPGIGTEAPFRLIQENGRWWFLTPDEQKFFAIGIDQLSFYTHKCFKRGGMPYHENCTRKYGNEETWAKDAAAKMRRWGFNTVGVSDRPGRMLEQGFPFPVFTAIGSAFAHRSAFHEPANWRYFPNVFDPAFEAGCLERARAVCAPYLKRNDVLGYFLDNELQWRGSNPPDSDLWDDTMRLNSGNPAKSALIATLRHQHQEDRNDFQRVWQVRISDWEELRKLDRLQETNHPRCREIKLDFFRQIAERYYRGTTRALRAVDSGRLILGNRFAGRTPDWVIEAAGRYCDVISLNAYPIFDLERGDLESLTQDFDRVYHLSGRPLYLTEWSFPAMDTPLPNQAGGGMRVDTQIQRARAAELLQTKVFSLPYFVGSNYLMWADQSPFGRDGAFSENCNYGLVNEQNEPYRELTECFARLNPMVSEIHAGTAVLPPELGTLSAVSSNTIRFLLRNRSLRETVCRLRVQTNRDQMPQLREFPLTAGQEQEWEITFPDPRIRCVRIATERSNVWKSIAFPSNSKRVAAQLVLDYRDGTDKLRGGFRILPVPASFPLVALRWNGQIHPTWRLAPDTLLVVIPPLNPGTFGTADLIPRRLAPPSKTVQLLGKNGFQGVTPTIQFGSPHDSGDLIAKMGPENFPVGNVRAMLKDVSPENRLRWRSATRPSSIRVNANGVTEISRIICSKVGKPEAELTVSLVVLPNFPGVILTPRCIRNLGDKPLRVLGFYLQAFATAKPQVPRTAVPRYYHREWRNVWQNPDNGGKIGAYSPVEAMQVRFWRSPDGSAHPDARIEFFPAIEIASGQNVQLSSGAPLIVWATRPETEADLARKFDAARQLKTTFVSPAGTVLNEQPNLYEYP